MKQIKMDRRSVLKGIAGVSLGLSGVECMGTAADGEISEATDKFGRMMIAEQGSTGMALDKSIVKVTQFGATGDGQTDDTAAIKKAMAALPEKGGVLFFPPGTYATDTIKPPSFCTLLAHGAWGYRLAGGVVLTPVRDHQHCLIDATGCVGTRLVGLTLDGKKRGKDMCGVFVKRGDSEQNVVVDDCRIEHFSGSGLVMDIAHVWAVRHSIIDANGLDGIDAHRGFDAWIIDNQITANGRYGVNLLASTTVTGNRIEHNKKAGIHLYGRKQDGIQVTGNLFCTNHGPAIDSPGEHRCATVTGNSFRFNGAFPISDDPAHNCHARFRKTYGLVMTGNSFNAVDRYPSIGLTLEGLVDSVVANNTLFQGATRELIRDIGGHVNTVIDNNPGSIVSPERPAVC